MPSNSPQPITQRLRPRPPRAGFPAAFTIVELLVVVAIIVILTAIGAGVVGSMNRSADLRRARTTAQVLQNALEEYRVATRQSTAFSSGQAYGSAPATEGSSTSSIGVFLTTVWTVPSARSILRTIPGQDEAFNFNHVSDSTPAATAKVLDPWGNPFEYRSASPEGSASWNYLPKANQPFFWSRGPDGKPTTNATTWTSNQPTGEGADDVLSIEIK